MVKTKWNEGEYIDEKEFAGFEGDPEDIPSYAVSNKSACALIKHNDYGFEEPIWLHPQTGYELAEAGVIDYDESINDLSGYEWGKLTVYVYTSGGY